MSSTDVESLQPASRQRSRCLDAFLLGSVITLFVMVLSGAALGFWVVKDLRADMETWTKHVPRAPERRTSPEGSPNVGTSFKVQDFAYLTAVYSQLKNGSMYWKPIKYRDTSTIGSRYRFDSNHHALTMLEDGTYFLYIELNVTCTSSCSKGSLSVTFEDGQGNKPLSCSLHLKTPETSVKKCWTVIPHLPSKSRLMARMHATVSALDGWKLELNHSGFGLFLVDGP